jgi:hypothetical protein
MILKIRQPSKTFAIQHTTKSTECKTTPAIQLPLAGTHKDL